MDLKNRSIVITRVKANLFEEEKMVNRLKSVGTGAFWFALGAVTALAFLFSLQNGEVRGIADVFVAMICGGWALAVRAVCTFNLR